MEKGIVICGQTGTGKTSLALKLAKQHNGVIISADSRQVFKEMDIGTGKYDHNDIIEKKPDHVILNSVPIYGIDLVNPDTSFSSGEFARYANDILNKIKSEKKLPIIVGGTGFYIKSLLLPDETVHVPLNSALREELEQYEKTNTKEDYRDLLIGKLQSLDEEKVTAMNDSDKNNPRRLIRAIEVALWKKDHPLPHLHTTPFTFSWYGLKAPRVYLLERIEKRVNEMFSDGLKKEVEDLTKKYSWDSPGLRTIGYREWQGYFNNEYDENTVKEKIVLSHIQYARKQLIYFKRYDFIHWLDISIQDAGDILQEQNY